MAERSPEQRYGEFVAVRSHAYVAELALDRPKAMNAVSSEMARSLAAACEALAADRDVRVVVVTSTHERAFCVGADLKERNSLTDAELVRQRPVARAAYTGVLDLPMPTIAAVHGYALGLGYSLAQSCDLIVAAEGTKFQIREVQRGLGGAQHWVATWFWTGSRFANEVALTGRMFDAGEALQHGMVNRVVPEAKRIATAEALAAEIVENPPLAVRANVRVMRWFVNEMQRQSRLYTQGRGLHLTDDFRESAEAFVAKRKPIFKGK